MTTTTKYFEELGELYTGTLVSNAYSGGAAGTISDAVITAAGVNPDLVFIGLDLTTAAEKLTHDAMGYLEHCLGTLDKDWMDSRRDWHRIDEFWRNCEKACISKDWPPEEEAAEAGWVHIQLIAATRQAWDDYQEHCLADWSHDLPIAAAFLGAAANLVAEAFQITEVQS